MKINNLSFCYANNKHNTISDLSLDLSNYQTTAIIGASGSGKSTLLRLIAGFEEAQCGIISLDNEILNNDHIHVPTEKRNIGMVFQNYVLFPHLTIEQNIAYGLDRLKSAEKSQRIDEVFELIQLQEHRKKFPHMLSGGQQQRVALGRAIAPRPRLILLDEPFSNLDSFLHNKIKYELKTILDRANIASILVTHHASDLDIAEHIVYLENGTVTKAGTLQELREDKNCPFVHYLLNEEK